ncbi:hypothetical protein [Rhodohalobacter sp.]|uniref:hypothetical protein n=1 Tax=Rhodohalobacter sp. TaxID=1974210 RepID=UPI002ACD8635|nr:hypothetical protein [Rhodohalobacter sp.]MDZ7757975.1 hypothetical protein [Rhodohalobacter sp.]
MAQNRLDHPHNKRIGKVIMTGLTGTLIYWYISVGLIVGLSMAIIIGKEGVSFNSNIIFGVIASVGIGNSTKTASSWFVCVQQMVDLFTSMDLLALKGQSQ